MIIAVAYTNGQINEHFGHAECFALYDFPDNEVEGSTKRLIECSDRHGHQAMADLMRDNNVDAVIVGNMGGEARAILLTYGIVPVAGYAGNADMAAEMLITGQLPILPEGAGACGGGCGGCGGGCGCHDGEESGEGHGCGGCCH